MMPCDTSISTVTWHQLTDHMHVWDTRSTRACSHVTCQTHLWYRIHSRTLPCSFLKMEHAARYACLSVGGSISCHDRSSAAAVAVAAPCAVAVVAAVAAVAPNCWSALAAAAACPLSNCACSCNPALLCSCRWCEREAAPAFTLMDAAAGLMVSPDVVLFPV